MFLIILDLFCVGENWQSLSSSSTQQLDHLWPMEMREIQQMLSLFIPQVKIPVMNFLGLLRRFLRIKHKEPIAVENSMWPLYIGFLSLTPLSFLSWDYIPRGYKQVCI